MPARSTSLLHQRLHLIAQEGLVDGSSLDQPDRSAGIDEEVLRQPSHPVGLLDRIAVSLAEHRASSEASSTLIPCTTAPLPRLALQKLSRAGASVRHGSHQDAQKLTSTQWPR